MIAPLRENGTEVQTVQDETEASTAYIYIPVSLSYVVHSSYRVVTTLMAFAVHSLYRRGKETTWQP